jgi:hypothetical protein
MPVIVWSIHSILLMPVSLYDLFSFEVFSFWVSGPLHWYLHDLFSFDYFLLFGCLIACMPVWSFPGFARPGGPDRDASTLVNWVGMARINYARAVLRPSGGHVGQHGTTHYVIRVMPGLSLRHEHGLIQSWAGLAWPELQDYLIATLSLWLS